MEEQKTPEWFTPEEAAAYMHMSLRKVYRLIKIGKIAAHNLSAGDVRKRHTINRKELDKFLYG